MYVYTETKGHLLFKYFSYLNYESKIVMLQQFKKCK